MIRKMPFILMIVIVAILLLNQWIPLPVKQALYATSLTIQASIILLLPLIIFSLLFNTMITMSRQATIVVALILVCVCISNFTATFLSHYVGTWIYQFNLSILIPNDVQGLKPAWLWQFPRFIANDKAMLLGIVAGIVLGRMRGKTVLWLSKTLDRIVMRILGSFIFIIPIFIAGFIIKLQHDGVMYMIIKDYTLIFLLVAFAQFVYIFSACALLHQLKFRTFYSCIKNMLPAAITGFSTMSSVAAMPLTIAGVENNAKNKSLSRSVIPATVNIHLIGDCIAIPIFAYAVMKSYGMAEPALINYLVFVFYFVLAKFSVAAVPGGGIIVMLPILHSYLGFNAEMLSLMTALYILFDPVITCANVLGNGVFATLIDKLMSLGSKKRAISTSLMPQ